MNGQSGKQWGKWKAMGKASAHSPTLASSEASWRRVCPPSNNPLPYRALRDVCRQVAPTCALPSIFVCFPGPVFAVLPPAPLHLGGPREAGVRRLLGKPASRLPPVPPALARLGGCLGRFWSRSSHHIRPGSGASWGQASGQRGAAKCSCSAPCPSLLRPFLHGQLASPFRRCVGHDGPLGGLCVVCRPP